MTRFVVFAALFQTLTAHARGPVHQLPFAPDTSLERYAHDLIGQNSADRLYAARVLHRRVREAWRTSVKDSSDIRVIEAKQTLADFDTLVAPKCIRQLKVSNTLRPCASILGMLETEAAVDALKWQLGQENSRRNRRVINRALGRIQASQ
ncbi:MAG: hypothetical protein ACPGTU_15285 [Myxococcota bacterium]